MRGVGTGWAAISVVNALFTGVGSAAAIGIPATAYVEIRTVPAGSSGQVSVSPESDTPLVRGSLLEAIRRFGAGADVDASVRVESAIPVAKGLKSSSAVSVAVLRAAAAAYGTAPTSESIASASADVSLAIGLSATGAFDDALASASGGVVVTENGSRRVHVRGVVDPDWAVVLWTPGGSHAPSPTWAARFEAERGPARAAVAAADRGEWLTAMAANTELVERVMGYEYRPVRRALERAGALGSGVSGLGPTLATVVPRARIRDVVRQHPAGSTAVTSAEFAGPPMDRGGGP
ncbi:MAG: shikimate kinase [Candidatus Lutacidiplasmatales archaeon]|nr:shikimate kinase [Thermoplasmata archaeon]